jgi:hypothetical protein
MAPPRAKSTAAAKIAEAAKVTPAEPDEQAVVEAEQAPPPANVIEAIAAVMRDVTFVGKDGYNEQNRFNFRGIDGTVNALGPVFRKYGLVVLPRLLADTHEQVETGRNRTLMNWTRVTVEYRFFGPGGAQDVIEVVTPGESFDSGDKGTAKAMSVAFRTALLQAFALPTQERDPDADSHEVSTRLTGAEVQAKVAQALEQAEVEDRDPIAALKVVWDDYGQTALEGVQIETKNGTVTGAAYINQWVEYITTKRREQAEAKKAEQDAAAEGATAQTAEQQPAAAPEGEAPKMSAHAILGDEIMGQAQALGIAPAAHVEPLIAAVEGAQRTADVPPAQVLKWVIEQRPRVVAALREQGRAQEAAAYEAAPPAWATWAELTAPREDARTDAQEPAHA